MTLLMPFISRHKKRRLRHASGSSGSVVRNLQYFCLRGDRLGISGSIDPTKRDRIGSRASSALIHRRDATKKSLAPALRGEGFRVWGLCRC